MQIDYLDCIKDVLKRFRNDFWLGRRLFNTLHSERLATA